MSVDAMRSVLSTAVVGRQQGTKIANSAVTNAGVEIPAQSPPSQEPTSAAVRAAVQQIDSYLKSVDREVEFRIDEDTGRTVVTVRQAATGEVIRQIPNEEVLQLARHLDTGSGTVLDLTV